MFERAHSCVVDRDGCSHLVELHPQVGLEAGLAVERCKILQIREADELRIDRHRAKRRIGRCLERRHLVNRQQLEHALPRACHPRCHRWNVANLTDTPTPGRGHGEQRHEQAGATRRWWGQHCTNRSSRATASANDSSGGRRLTTR